MLHKISLNRKFSGQIVLCYGIWYGFERGFLELIRTDSLTWGLIRISSLLSFVICITCAIILFVVTRKLKVEENREYTNIITEDEEEIITENEDNENGEDN